MNLLDLPEEVIEGIFEHVQEDDILQLKLVNKAINLIITGSVGIRYRFELFLAGLEDHRSSGPEPLNERLNKLRSWQSRWDQARFSPPQTIILPGGYRSGKCCLYGGVFAMYSEGLIHFTRLPSPSRGIPLTSWTTPHLGFEPVGNFAMDPDQDLLMVMERETIDVLAILVLDMHGRKHPRSSFLSLSLRIEELQSPGTSIKLAQVKIAGPNVTVLVVLDLEREGGCKDLLWVFDWTNGQLKLRLERLDIRNVTLIDEFHLVSSSLNPQDKRSYCLGVHDLRQRLPRVLFELPPHSSPYFNPGVFCYPRSGPVSTFHGSPVNAILAMVIHECLSKGTTLVVVHPQNLYSLMEQGDPYIRWGQWKDKAELFTLGTLWGEPGNELQMTAGLRLILPAGRRLNHTANPNLWLHTFEPWRPPRGNIQRPGMRFRTEDISFHVRGSSPFPLPLISEEHILWIDREHHGVQDVYSLVIFPV